MREKSYLYITHSGDALINTLASGGESTKSRHHDRLFEVLLRASSGVHLGELYNDLEQKFPSREAFFDLIKKLLQAGYIVEEGEDSSDVTISGRRVAIDRQQAIRDQQIRDEYSSGAKSGYGSGPDEFFDVDLLYAREVPGGYAYESESPRKVLGWN